MLEAIRRAILFLRQKQILHKLGVVISVTVIGIACYVLYHMLRGIDVDEVFEAIREHRAAPDRAGGLVRRRRLFHADLLRLFAMRAIGRSDVPYRINALAAFTSYSIGHNVGASVFTGGAVRYRIYSAYGLNAIDVAKICFLAGLTFWLGNAAVLGLGITYHPEAAASIDQLPVWLNRVVAIAIILGLVAYVGWVWTQPRNVGRGPWTVVLPGGPLTLLQIMIGIVDLGFCALAMYVLVPDEPNLGFVVVAVIFVSATLLGFASHSPGGLGVFDAAMLVGLWQMDREDLLAGMLLFRLLYYIAPFVISVILLTFREVILGADRSGCVRRRCGLTPVRAREAAYVRERGDKGALTKRGAECHEEAGQDGNRSAPVLSLAFLAMVRPAAAFGHYPRGRRARARRPRGVR